MADAVERVLAVVAHPDDARGRRRRHHRQASAAGAEAIYVIVTDGSTGSSDRAMTRDRLVQVREAEQRDAARMLGVKHVEG